ncbi:DEAD/DEAH box helicase domain-containing protein [Tieghemostelium lacteum]|uniref:DNA replication ATP-dependent helicase/nuclease n=1 Tax=Tieghemostelium lacteum TaxID=361077 RepID=A0A152A2A7_TIELA|nr:DEAD/DEAH box helicase domain-containing protein [Tieghemostelium lacteum]|eukprot:KYR00392.1 DEAD/DEAH box helicase domain-containing protein [Tieghemostelium lacteum]
MKEKDKNLIDFWFDDSSDSDIIEFGSLTPPTPETIRLNTLFPSSPINNNLKTTIDMSKPFNASEFFSKKKLEQHQQNNNNINNTNNSKKRTINFEDDNQRPLKISSNSETIPTTLTKTDSTITRDSFSKMTLDNKKLPAIVNNNNRNNFLFSTPNTTKINSKISNNLNPSNPNYKAPTTSPPKSQQQIEEESFFSDLDFSDFSPSPFIDNMMERSPKPTGVGDLFAANFSPSPFKPSFSPLSKTPPTPTKNVRQNLSQLFQKELNSQSNLKKQRFERILVINIEYDVTILPNQYLPLHKKTIIGYSETLRINRTIVMVGEWLYSPVYSGNFVNVIGDFDETNSILISNQKNLLVLHPDILITGTELSNSYSCARRTVLKDQLKWTMDSSVVPLYGSIVHEIFQQCLRTNSFSLLDIERFKNEILVKPHFSLGLSSLGETQSTAMNHLDNWVPSIDNFAKTFILENDFKAKASFTLRNNEKYKLSISKILEIEENIWSPMYGLKGKIDATVEIKLVQQDSYQNGRKKCVSDPEIRYLNVPLEVKTGKAYSIPNNNHSSQVLIYTLLMNDRYNQDIDLGLLYYLKNQNQLDKKEQRIGENYGILHPILSERNNIRSLLVARNLLAHFFQQNLLPTRGINNSVIPKMLKDQHACETCYFSDPCLLYHKAIENGSSDSSGVPDLFDLKTNHLSTLQIDQLQKLNKMVTLESEVNKNISKKYLWTQPKSTEKKDISIQNLILTNEVELKTGGFTYKFSQFNNNNNQNNNNLIQFTEGDYVSISVVGKWFGLGSGQIIKITNNSLIILCREKISEPPTKFDEDGIKKGKKEGGGFRGIVNIEYENDLKDNIDFRGFGKRDNLSTLEYRWKIDVESQHSNYSILKSNVFNLFHRDNQELCKLLIDLRPPSYSVKTGSELWKDIQLSRDYPHLNMDQQKAIEKVILSNDYSLILGMPGTGKTTTLSACVSVLNRLGFSVLIISYTHTALDNLLVKISDSYPTMEYLRLAGQVSQVDTKVQSHCLESHHFTSITQIKEFLDRQTIIATTCFGMSHSYFNSTRKFDYCIVDEASQLSQPVTIGPLLYAKRFVLVGDHYQLPPLVQNPEAKKLGMDISLFKKLSSQHPFSVSNLTFQYRMSQDIMSISNTLVYNGKLKCGNSIVSNHQLNIPNLLLESSESKFVEKWLYETCYPKRSVVFLNTDTNETFQESKLGDFFYNLQEANTIARIVDCLVNLYSISPSDIGVLSPHRLQLKYIKNALISQLKSTSLVLDSSDANAAAVSSQLDETIKKLDVLTIDKFQGKDKDCIIISFVKSNTDKTIGELLQDWRRSNVALTRARQKLILIGSRSTLSSFPFYNDLFKLIETNQINLPSFIK